MTPIEAPTTGAEEHPPLATRAGGSSNRGWFGRALLAVIAALLAVVAVRLAPSAASADPERPALANPIEQRQRMIEELQGINARLERVERELKALGG